MSRNRTSTNAVMTPRTHGSPENVSAVIHDKHNVAESILDSLTPRQRQVALLIAEGYSNIEIAAQIDMSLNTVEKQAISLYQMYSVSASTSMTQRVRLARLVWEEQVGELVDAMLAERQAA